MIRILVLYYSRHGSTRALAKQIAKGIEQHPDCEAILRTVPDVSPANESTTAAIPQHGDLYISNEDLEQCDGLALGSPTRFGKMAAPLQYFFEQTTAQWLNGTLSGKPATVFTSSASMHGGQESTLLGMMLPLLHHGMLMLGVPYTGTNLSATQSGGTPYGASHVSGESGDSQLSQDEQELALIVGKRLAKAALATKGKDI